MFGTGPDGVDFNSLALAPCIEAFGQQALYVPGDGRPMRVFGIFNAYATDTKMGSDGEMRQVSAPTFALNLAQFPGGQKLPCKGQMLDVAGQRFQIAEPVVDNFGQLLLKLKRIAP